MKNKTVCIVSPDIVGPIKNGGIGTHCYYLAQVLANNGIEVSILFTGPLQNKTHEFWKEYYQNFNIKYYQLDTLKKGSCRLSANDFLNTSYFVCEFLKQHCFDFIHFQEWLANGLVTIQTKETTTIFDNSLITVNMHSSTQWQQEGMMQYSKNPVYDGKLNWAEQYCVQHCDMLLSPSEYMLTWAKQSHWQLAKKQKVIPNCYIGKEKSQFNEKEIDFSHLIFFGRLETRKGLEYFVESVLKLDLNSINKISFLGKVSQTSEGTASQYINKKFNKGITYKIYSDFDTFEALEFIQKERGLVVIPSLVDNYPYTVVEMIENNLPFICSNSGGTPEMVNEQVLFDVSDENALASLLKTVKQIPFANIQHKYKANTAAQSWVNLHDLPTKSNLINASEPMVSICVPYYNYPKYLPLLLASIEQIDYQNYEVIIVNDGSPQKNANRIFDELQKQYKQHRFFHKENSGVGDTRNYAAAQANGKYLIFMDSDNLAYPNMIADFVYAIEKSQADCVTCYFDAFEEKFEGISPKKVLYKYLPLGGAKEAGILENVFGDANFIIKKEVFNHIKGFGTEKHTSWEDWEILAKLNLNGYMQKVIPKSLFWYRHTEAGFSRNTNPFNNHQRIIKCYQEHYQGDAHKLITAYIIPFFYDKGNNLAALNQLINKVLPINSVRRETVKKLIKGVLNR